MNASLERYGLAGLLWRYAAIVAAVALLGAAALRLLDRPGEPACVAHDPQLGHCIATTADE